MKRCWYCGHHFRMLEWADWHTEGECAVPDTAPDGMLWCSNILKKGSDDNGVAYRLRNRVAKVGEQLRPKAGGQLQILRKEREWTEGCDCQVCKGRLKLTKVSDRRWTSSID